MYNATVVKRTNITDELILLYVKPDKPFSPFLPGQYVALGLLGSSPRPEGFPPEKETPAPEKLIKRAYSIGSSPSELEHLEFYIAIVPDGALTSRLALIKEGDRIHAAPKITGTFTLTDVPADHNLVLVSTGTGIAPYMSMLRTPTTWEGGRSITLIHGVRYAKDLAYREELESIAKAKPGFSYFPIVSRDDPSWNGKRGHVQRLFSDGSLTLNGELDHVFVCGNPAMIDDMEKMLGATGYTVHSKRNPGKLHIEKYW